MNTNQSTVTGFNTHPSFLANAAPITVRLLFMTAFAAALVSSTLLILIKAYPTFATGADDANIYFVYAKNLVEGYGITYNPGGERVEGFTSILWLLICAAAYALHGSIEQPLIIINGFLMICTMLLCTAFLLRNLHSRYTLTLTGLFLLVLAASPGFIIWMGLSLLENALWTLTLSALALGTYNALTQVHTHLEDHKPRTSTLFMCALAIAPWVRPEAIAYSALCTVSIFAAAWAILGLQSAVRHCRTLMIATVLSILLLTAFRLSYFGFPFPNTFYAKVDSSLMYNLREGIGYLLNYFHSNAFAFIALSGLLIASADLIVRLVRDLFHRATSEIGSTKRLPSTLMGHTFLALFGLATISIPVALGGDHFSEFRFFQNAFPVILMSGVLYVDRLLSQFYRTNTQPTAHQAPLITRAMIVCIIAGVIAINGFKSYRTLLDGGDILGEFHLAESGRERGEVLNRMFADLPPPNVGVVAAGGFKYTYDGPVFDVLGLNHIAMGQNEGQRHGIKNNAAFNKSVFYQYAPDMLVMEAKERDWASNTDNAFNDYIVSALKGIQYDEEFRSLYDYVAIESEFIEDKLIIGWVKRDYLNNLSPLAGFTWRSLL